MPWPVNQPKPLRKCRPNPVSSSVDLKPETAMGTNSVQVVTWRRPAFNWRTVGIVAGICAISTLLLGMVAEELVSQEMITVIAVAAIFLLLLGFSAARSKALAERPKWFI